MATSKKKTGKSAVKVKDLKAKKNPKGGRKAGGKQLEGSGGQLEGRFGNSLN